MVRLQAALGDWGQQVPWTGDYGDVTAAAVSAVQAVLRLPADGRASPAFLQAVGLNGPSRPLRPGDRGPDVQALQRALTRAGYPVAPTGRIGPTTAALIRQFQSDRGLPVTGVLALSTVEAALASEPAEAAVAAADGLVGAPYAWGGEGPAGFDCSGFVRYVYRQAGVDLPRTSRGQFAAGAPVPTADMRPGDLVFFDTWGSGASHVGIYLGGGVFVHAGDYETGVEIASLSEPYYADHLVGARRVAAGA